MLQKPCYMFVELISQSECFPLYVRTYCETVNKGTFFGCICFAEGLVGRVGCRSCVPVDKDWNC